MGAIGGPRLSAELMVNCRSPSEGCSFAELFKFNFLSPLMAELLRKSLFYAVFLYFIKSVLELTSY